MSAVPTRFGDLRLGIVDVGWIGLEHPRDEGVELEFRPDLDAKATAPLLGRTRSLTFELTAPHLETRLGAGGARRRNPHFIVYLGRNVAEWDDDLAIWLRPERGKGGQLVWIPNPPEQVVDFRHRHWCAAEATITLCEERERPVLHQKTGKPLQTRISLGYDDPWYSDLYRRICCVLEEAGSSADITSSLQELRAIARDAREAAEGSTALELYHRLRYALARYDGVLSTITAHPLRQPRRTLRTHFLQPWDTAAFHTDRAGQFEIVHIGKIARISGRVVPTQFLAAEHALSEDNAANRYASRSVAMVAGWVDDVARTLGAYIASEEESVQEFEQVETGRRIADGGRETEGRSMILARREAGIRRHQDALAALAETQDRLRRFEGMLPPHRGPLVDCSEDAPALAFDPRYAELRRQTQRLSQAIHFVDASPEVVPYEVEPFNEVYARWCFIKVVEALLAIGFEFEGAAGRRTTPFYHHPVPHQINCVMVHPAISDTRLDVWYERRYPFHDPDVPHLYGVETRAAAGRTSYQKVDLNWVQDFRNAKRTPDIALEFFRENEQVPGIVTLDPSLKRSPEKFEYRQSIRSLVDGDYENDGRASRMIVEAAWGIHPGSRWAQDPVEHGTPENPDYRHGFLVLRPEAQFTKALPVSLARIMERSSVVPEGTLILARGKRGSAA